jgi:hypothetical protein
MGNFMDKDLSVIQRDLILFLIGRYPNLQQEELQIIIFDLVASCYVKENRGKEVFLMDASELYDNSEHFIKNGRNE